MLKRLTCRSTSTATNTRKLPSRISINTLSWKESSHKAAILQLDNVDAKDTNAFQSKLKNTLLELNLRRRTSAWLEVPIEQSALCAAAGEVGFVFHHASGKSVVMKCWLDRKKTDPIPPYATHQVGCAGFVLNSYEELLVVKEQGGSGQWKLPGGLMDPGEDIPTTTTREVFEETAITSKFESLLGFWHRPINPLGMSTWRYTVSLLRATSHDIRLDDREISAGAWIPLKEFIESTDHPLILRVCREIFNLTPDNVADKVDLDLSVPPRRVMTETTVQWPGRPPYQSFFAGCNDEMLLKDAIE